MIHTKVTYTWHLEIDGFEVGTFEGDATFVVKHGQPILTNIETDGFKRVNGLPVRCRPVELDETNFRYFKELWDFIEETYSEEAKQQADEYARDDHADTLRGDRINTFRLAAE